MRSAFLSNGRLGVLFDSNYVARDFYYPHLGYYNNSMGGKFPIGVWKDGKFSWVVPSSVTAEGLVYRAEFTSQDMRITLEDAVDISYDALVRHVKVDGEGLFRLIFYHDFRLKESEVGDTAFYEPSLDAIIHYKRDLWVLVGSSAQVYQYTTGRRDQNAVYEDCQDGELSKNPIAQGSVASAVSIASKDFYYWIAFGNSYGDLRSLHGRLREEYSRSLPRSMGYWRSLTSGFDDGLLRNSLAIVLGHFGNNGEVPASLDTDIMKFNLDTYSYTWPRDAALTANVLDQLGYSSFTRVFYRKALENLEEGGYMFQKFSPDWSWGSTWHPWTSRTRYSMNIQEDETALLIWAFCNYLDRSKDYDLLKATFPRIRRAAKFMINFRDEKLGLPLMSYDLWEELLGVHPFTVATVYGALTEASRIARSLGEEGDATEWAEVAEGFKRGLMSMFQRENGMFPKTVKIEDGKVLEVDRRAESSTLLIPMFRILPYDDPMVVSNARAVREKLWVGPSGGLARYEQDYYQRVDGDYNSIPGNPWLITTLWLAQQMIATGDQGYRDLVTWVKETASSTGLLPEQVSPFDRRHLSVTPLLWSHAELLRTESMLR